MNPMTMLSDGVAAFRAMTASGLERWSGVLRLTSATDAPGIMPGRRVAGSPGRRVAGSPGRRVAGSPGRRVAVPVRAVGHERARIAGPLPPANLTA